MQRRHAQRRRDLRICAAGQQQLHQHEIARLRCPQERGRAVLVEPLVGEHRPDLGAVFHPGIDVGALVEEQPDEIQVIHVAAADRIIAVLDVAVIGGQVERGPPARVREVRVGALVEEKRAELVIAVLRRDQQRAPAVAGHLVHVRAGGQQHLHRLEIVGANGIHQRRQRAAVVRRLPDTWFVCLLGIRHRGGRRCGTGGRACCGGAADLQRLQRVQVWRSLPGGKRRTLGRHGLSRIVRFAERRPSSARSRIRARPDVRSPLDQELQRCGVPFIGRPHQRRRSPERFARVHIGAAVQQDLHRVHVSGARRNHERPSPERKRLVGVGAGGEERFDDRGIAIHARQPERRHAGAVCRFHIRARADQQIDQCPVAAVDRPVQRRRAVGLGGVHVGALRQQRLHGCRVAALGGVGDVARGGRCRTSYIHEGDEDYEGHEEQNFSKPSRPSYPSRPSCMWFS